MFDLDETNDEIREPAEHATCEFQSPLLDPEAKGIFQSLARRAAENTPVEFCSTTESGPKEAKPEARTDTWRGDTIAARDRRVADSIQAIKDMKDNGDKWYVLRSRLVAEYESGGNNPAQCERNLREMIARVNRGLGKDGEIKSEPVNAQLRALLAEGERMKDPDLVLGFRVKHPGGQMGPIGVCFKAKR